MSIVSLIDNINNLRAQLKTALEDDSWSHIPIERSTYEEIYEILKLTRISLMDQLMREDDRK